MTKIRNYPLDTVIQDTDTLIGTDEGNNGATKTFPLASLSAYINGQGPQGTVTSVSGTGTVSGITLSGTVTESGSLTLGGSLSISSEDIISFLGYTPYNATNPEGYTSFAEPAIFSGGGTPTLATGVTAEEVRTLIGVDGSGGVNPKVYVAELSNLGAGEVAPVATVMKNTIGNIVWTRTGVGSYTGTLAGAFTEDKTFLSGQSVTTSTLIGATGNWPNTQVMNSNNVDTVRIYNYALNLSSGDNLSDNMRMFLEIRVYE